MASQPKNAAEVLKVWRETVTYRSRIGVVRRLYGDPPGRTEEEMFADANRVLQLARMEGIGLEQLIPDAKERQELIDNAKEFDELDFEDPYAV